MHSRTSVARRVRAWIETKAQETNAGSVHVARRVRAWIETQRAFCLSKQNHVARRVRAWIETPVRKEWQDCSTSPAVCGRGLKPVDMEYCDKLLASPAVCGRGLKRYLLTVWNYQFASPAVCGRGLKRCASLTAAINKCRPPCAGVD